MLNLESFAILTEVYNAGRRALHLQLLRVVSHLM